MVAAKGISKPARLERSVKLMGSVRSTARFAGFVDWSDRRVWGRACGTLEFCKGAGLFLGEIMVALAP